MKALTIRQPWASLIAAGVKTIETRSWSTKYRGPLAIHAGMHRPAHCMTVGQHQVLDQADGVLRLCGPPRFDLGPMPDIPLGAVVATCTLVDVIPIGPGVLWNGTPARRDGRPLPPENHGWLNPGPSWRWIYIADECDRPSLVINEGERPFGDFTPGRYAWLLTDITPLAEPIPVRGRQGLWDWED